MMNLRFLCSVWMFQRTRSHNLKLSPRAAFCALTPDSPAPKMRGRLLGKEVLYDAQGENCIGDRRLARHWPRDRLEAGGKRGEGCGSLLSERGPGQSDAG